MKCNEKILQFLIFFQKNALFDSTAQHLALKNLIEQHALLLVTILHKIAVVCILLKFYFFKILCKHFQSHTNRVILNNIWCLWKFIQKLKLYDVLN